MAFHFVDSHRKLNCEAFITDDFYHFRLVFQLFTFIFDFGDHGKARSNLRLHGVKDFKVGIFRLKDPDPGRTVGEVPNLNSNFIILIDFNIFENDNRRDDLEGLVFG